MKVGDLVVWRTMKQGGSVLAIIISFPHSEGNIARIMTSNGHLYTVPLHSHYVLEVISETR